MIREFSAYYALCLQKSSVQAEAIDYLVRKSERVPARWPALADLGDDHARLLVLSQAIATELKELARTGTRKAPGGHRYWLKYHSRKLLEERRQYLERLGLLPQLPDLNALPPGSWAIQFTFTLARPYLSQDDTEFYIQDNPVRKEWVFKVPYIAPSQWKGALRGAMVRLLVEENPGDAEEWIWRRLQLARLFGNEKGVGVDDERFESFLDKQRSEAVAREYRKRLKSLTETGFLSGRLHFFPTFFDLLGLEVINPHPRETGAGKQPIYFECVPTGAKGTFTLLYVPLDGGPADEVTVRADLEATAKGVQAMMTRYGFGAKISSGYGTAEDVVEYGCIYVQGDKRAWKYLSGLKDQIVEMRFQPGKSGR